MPVEYHQEPDASPVRLARLCAELHGYSKADFTSGERDPVNRRRVRSEAEENIVAPAVAGYNTVANPPAGPGPAVLPK
ncbi:MAG: hypothetical protein AB7H90_18640 [Alphaproteobacteria bacterium]